MPVRNDALVDGLKTDFIHQKWSTTAWGNVASNYLMLPQLRGFWPFSSADGNGDIYELSGQGRAMTNTNTVAFGVRGLVPYADFIAANSEYFTRADEAGTSITGALSVGCWCSFDAPSTGSQVGLVTKRLAAGNQRSYHLCKLATDAITFTTNSTGAAAGDVSIGDSAANYATGEWFFVAGVYVPSTTMTLYVNDNVYTLAVGVPASIFDSTASLQLGTFSGSNYLDGKITLCFLCATNLTDGHVKAIYHHSRSLFGV